MYSTQSIDCTLSISAKDESLPQYQLHTTDSDQQDQHRNRSHSHGDVYYHRGTTQRSPRSAMSSGYSSYASSTAQVDAALQSQESLEKMSPLHVAHHSGPFAARPPHPGNVQRGGSLKASIKYSTSRNQAPPLVQSRFKQCSY